MAILVTGGAGYIGSHTCGELLERGDEIIVVDNFSNSSPVSLSRVEQITGKSFKFYEINLCDIIYVLTYCVVFKSKYVCAVKFNI